MLKENRVRVFGSSFLVYGYHGKFGRVRMYLLNFISKYITFRGKKNVCEGHLTLLKHVMRLRNV